jgi:hypothetical protein
MSETMFHTRIELQPLHFLNTANSKLLIVNIQLYVTELNISCKLWSIQWLCDTNLRVVYTSFRASVDSRCLPEANVKSNNRNLGHNCSWGEWHTDGITNLLIAYADRWNGFDCRSWGIWAIVWPIWHTPIPVNRRLSTDVNRYWHSIRTKSLFRNDRENSGHEKWTSRDLTCDRIAFNCNSKNKSLFPTIWYWYLIGVIHVRFEVLKAVNMKNVVLWDIKTLFIPHKKHVTSLLQRPTCKYKVRFEISRLWLCRMPYSGIWKPSSYLTGNTTRLCYRAQPVNAMYDLRFPRRWLWRISCSGI